jgi:ribonuclease HI
VLLSGEHRKELSGAFRETTSNRMELVAAIIGLESLKFACDVIVCTDSRYVMDGSRKVHEWQKNGWRLTSRKRRPVANSDMWERLLPVLDQHDVTFAWVKGHAGLRENERCDQLAAEAADQDAKHLETDAGFVARHRSRTSQEPVSEATPTHTNQSRPAPKPQPANSSRSKVTSAGQPCRKCGEPVVRREPRRRIKPGQTYYFEYYFVCPGCHTMYMVEEAKRSVRGS